MFDFNKKLNDFAKNAGWRLGKENKSWEEEWEKDWVTEKIQLRNKIHEQGMEISDLKALLRDNEERRKKDPMIQDAWEQYQVLLQLTK